MYWSMKRQIKTELIKSKYAQDAVKELIPIVMDQMGLRSQLQNEIFKLHSIAEAK